MGDAHGNFVNKRTAAYLQFGEEAFRHVESILADLLMEMEDEKQKTKPGEAPLAGAMERIPPEVSPSRQNDRKKQKKIESDDATSDTRSTSTGSPTTVSA